LVVIIIWETVTENGNSYNNRNGWCVVTEFSCPVSDGRGRSADKEWAMHTFFYKMSKKTYALECFSKAHLVAEDPVKAVLV
jgi:hypothetical protein